MSWCHGGLSRTISMVSVPPPYCRVTNAQRLPLQTSIKQSKATISTFFSCYLFKLEKFTSILIPIENSA